MSASPAFGQQPSFTEGLAKEINSGLFDCGSKDRVSAVGTIKADDGSIWTVPADTNFQTAPKATDLYNECADNTPENEAAIDLSAAPVFDAGGSEEFVAYIFADNYFELHVNGKLLAVDAVPFTPFNSSIVRFKAARPVTIAMKLVDWEEHLGLGSEANTRSKFHPGDGGVAIHIKDADGKTVAISDDTWRAQTFYIGPLKNKACLKLVGEQRDSSGCDSTDSEDGAGMFGAHWPLPENWTSSEFDDANWPGATTYTNETVGVRNKPAFTNFPGIFDAPDADAHFIWSSNLILDNLVLIRKTIN